MKMVWHSSQADADFAEGWYISDWNENTGEATNTMGPFATQEQAKTHGIDSQGRAFAYDSEPLPEL